MIKVRIFFLNKLLYFLQKIIKYLSRGLIIKNYLQKNYNRRVLISYITHPLIENNSNYHTNQIELFKLLECFDELKYEVDIVDYNIDTKIDYSKYDIIFGFGRSFEKSFYDSQFNGIRIFYSTGAEVNWQNNIEISRVLDFNKNHYSNYKPKRLVSEIWSLSYNLSNAIISIGNSWTLSTFDLYKVDKYSINASGALKKFKKNPTRDFVKCRKSFLWFGSGGAVLKGLDLCIDYFIQNPDLQLNICGPSEIDFYTTYFNLNKYKNIIFHGFVNPHSNFFDEIVTSCLFTIMPTSSEGQSTALITTMSTGLIPIATLYCGLDINKLGFVIKNLNVVDIEDSIKKIPFEDENYLSNMSNSVFEYTKEKHSIEYFKSTMTNLLKNILGES